MNHSLNLPPSVRQDAAPPFREEAETGEARGEARNGGPPCPQYIADFSLALINRTGAYYVCRDVVHNLAAHFARVRYWRLFLRSEPPVLLRKILGRAMLAELARLPALGRVPRRRGADLPTLYFDPLYVLHTQLEERDIVLCHDVGPVSHPHLFERKTSELYRRAYAAVQAARPGMVFVSEASRAEFTARYGWEYRFLEVIPLYVRKGLAEGPQEAPAGVTPPFLLTVGALEVRKNYPRILEAFARSGLRERGYSYVFCGPRGNSATEVQALAAATPGAINLGYATDAELRWLYHNAAVFVLPSLLEGFGVPPLEAAQYGLLSIVSNTGAQREAVGEAAVFTDPLSVDAIAAAMQEALALPEAERARRVALARAHAATLTREHYLARWGALLCANGPSSASRA